MNQIEAMKLALEALKATMATHDTWQAVCDVKDEAIIALSQAIEQAEQVQPVAWDGRCVLGHCGSPSGCEFSEQCVADNAPAQQWTDETAKVPDHVWSDCRKTKTISGDYVWDCRIGECPEKENGRIGQECARQTSDGLGDRLPPSPQRVGCEIVQQEPQPPYEFERYVAGSLRAQGVRVERATTLADAMRIAAKICPPAYPPSAPTVLVYTAPPPRQPDPLTDDELDVLDMVAKAKANQNPVGTQVAWRKAYLREFARAIEAKLKEKNT